MSVSGSPISLCVCALRLTNLVTSMLLVCSSITPLLSVFFFSLLFFIVITDHVPPRAFTGGFAQVYL